MSSPDILLLGQVTIDDVVPPEPGLWFRQLGGNVLYAAAGARLWCDPQRIGVVTRLGDRFPFRLETILEGVGLSSYGVRRVEAEHLEEWFLYEEDGTRLEIPRTRALRLEDLGSPNWRPTYMEALAAVSPTADEIPATWLPAGAVLLTAQVEERHRASCAALVQKTEFLAVDPSPHYAVGMRPDRLREILVGAHAFLPSEREVTHLLRHSSPEEAATALARVGFREVVIKLGHSGVLLCETPDMAPRRVDALSVKVVDPTGAGDAFAGAYTACRAIGHPPLEAARRAVVSAGMVVEVSGAERALHLSEREAWSRLAG